MIKKELTGKRFGRLQVIKLDGFVRNRVSVWLCFCDCGTWKKVRSANLLNANTQSCGCLQRDAFGSISRTHGMSGSPEHRAWKHMRNRCYNPNVKEYPYYGGRGIKVCDRWLESFENFFADMGQRPSSSHSIDRFPNGDGDYEPGNVRWATDLEQSRNRSNNLFYTFNGETLILKEWADKLGFEYSFLRARLRQLKWTPEKAFTTPKKGAKP